MSLFQPVSIAEETGLSLPMSKNPEDRFCRVKAHIILKRLSFESKDYTKELKM